MEDIQPQRVDKYFKSFSFLWKGALGYLAYIAVFPVWLPAWLHNLVSRLYVRILFAG